MTPAPFENDTPRPSCTPSLPPSLPEEVLAAEAAKKTPGVEVVKLEEPLTVNGKTVSELCLDFRVLKLSTIRNIEKELLQTQEVVISDTALSKTYCAILAARACGMHVDDLDDLCYRDTEKVVQAVKNFTAKSAG